MTLSAGIIGDDDGGGGGGGGGKGSTDPSTLPDQAVHYYPGDDSGDDVTDAVGTNPLSINDQTRIQRDDFSGGYGLAFGGLDGLRGAVVVPQSLTYIVRIDAGQFGEESPTYRTVLAHGPSRKTPLVVYDVGSDEWRFDPTDTKRLVVSDPQASVESEVRILVASVGTGGPSGDGGSVLDVYDGAGNVVGSDTGNTTSIQPEALTMSVGSYHDGSRGFVGDMDPSLVIADGRLSDGEVAGVLDTNYGVSI